MAESKKPQNQESPQRQEPAKQSRGQPVKPEMNPLIQEVLGILKSPSIRVFLAVVAGVAFLLPILAFAAVCLLGPLRLFAELWNDPDYRIEAVLALIGLIEIVGIGIWRTRRAKRQTPQ